MYAALGEVLAGGPAEAVAAPSAVALTLSMGPAEWLLHRFRSGSLAGLRAARSPREFWQRMLSTLARCLAVYLVVLLALGLTGTLLWPGAPGLTAVRVATLLLLGTVMWTGLLLQSFGAVRPAAVVCASAAVAQSLALLTGLGPTPAGPARGGGRRGRRSGHTGLSAPRPRHRAPLTTADRGCTRPHDPPYPRTRRRTSCCWCPCTSTPPTGPRHGSG